MGETMSTIQSSNNNEMEKYMEKLHFVQNMEDHTFGTVEVFRLKEPPYQYIMDYKKTFMQGDNRFVKYINCMNQLTKTQHKNLAKIHLTCLKQQTHMCIKDKKTHTFCNYYNFTLMQAIKKKKQQQAIFTESELIYIMGCLVDLAQYLKKYNISIGQYRTSNIYLSPQGYIKLYLLQVDQQNRHNCYYKVLAQRQTLQNYILSPEQLKDLSKMQYDVTYDIYKSDLFAIAFIIFQLITQDHIKFYYNQDRTNYKFDRIQFDIEAVSKIYSEGFVNLLKKCLVQDPINRCSIEEAALMINNLKKSSPNCAYCIRLHDDQGKKKILNRKDSVQNSPKAPQFGNMKKLMPSPITTLSSTTSSFKGGHSVRNSTDFSNMNQAHISPHNGLSQNSMNQTSSSMSNFQVNNQRGIKSPTFTDNTSQNETHSNLIQKFAQKRVIYLQKGVQM